MFMPTRPRLGQSFTLVSVLAVGNRWQQSPRKSRTDPGKARHCRQEGIDLRQVG